MDSRVAHLDSRSLDDELRKTFWKQLQSVFPDSRFEDELKVVLDTLIFVCASKYIPMNGSTSTYGSRLSGTLFKARRRTLYLITILSGYARKKLSHLLFSTNGHALSQKCYRVLKILYDLFDFYNISLFLSSPQGTGKKYLSPLHRILNVKSVSDITNPSTYYQETAMGATEYQNRQLLWNAILELFNNTLLTSSRFYLTNGSKKKKVVRSGNKEVCHKCQNFPCNPYLISCCYNYYCYICSLKVLKRGECPVCKESYNLKFTPSY
ncbi:hypothetical protein NCAS_0D00120 [Naumovozyma castellii]|uniref:Uncharacterized protein n=1 Tax=Naumovozyma castellii TaxID=27288 RepID=G0VEX4_NAUCA|nr:hypothetical protein NCAS_0D00120 [Naumovozyma castellii CBS 4309]CCC69593.1 hypothetical protein NCAS_0D00120 [Naumovozyma castellii CBS 4309]